MSERNVQLLLEDICEAGRKILSYTEGMSYDDFRKDHKTVDAVVRNFGIISDAANRIPDDFVGMHPEIEWQQMTGFRDRITPNYFDVDHKALWQIKEEVLPELLEETAVLSHTP